MGKERGVISYALQVRRNIEQDGLQRMLNDYRDACRDSDVVIYDYAGFLGCFVAEALDVTVIGTFAEPLIAPTVEFRSPLMPGLLDTTSSSSFGGLYNRMSHVAAGQLFWQTLRPFINDGLISALGKSPIPFRGPFKQAKQNNRLSLFGFSPNVLDRPKDWPSSYHVTGFWFLDNHGSWQPPEELADFLAEGPPPICITLGSIVESDPQVITKLIVDSLESSGQRAILQAGWSGLGRMNLPDNVLRVGEVPHDWLFPQVAAVVHHGGAETTASALRAGKPSVIIPWFSSQPFWADTVVRLGVATPPIPRDELSSRRLEKHIEQATTDDEMRDAAERLAALISEEHGVIEAVRLIEDNLGIPKQSTP
jgi:UDP:flavonoid glycosyltransferase YjiC (YdhE family)